MDENWYQWLLERLVRSGPELEPNKLYIVTFNYDRSLEFFLWRALKASFKLSNEETARILGCIEIVHVYGTAGPLAGREEQFVGFGDISRAGVAATSINVVAPRTEPPAAQRVRQIVSECERICFLGFGFWQENLDLLGLQITGKKVFASCYNLPRTTKNELTRRFGADVVGTPVINFGREDQDVLAFLTHWDVLA